MGRGLLRLMTRSGFIVAALVLTTSPLAAAQPPPAVPAPAPYDANAWWTSRERVPEQLDPLGDRRAGRNAPRVVVDNGVHPLLYRLWGLPPLQTMVLRDGEVVIEVWSRRPRSAREVISRITVRRDGAVFVQARAGLGCCTTPIGKRVDIDAKLEADAGYFRTLARDPVWNQPTDVVAERPGVVAAVCVDGSAYDLTLLEYRRTRHLRRICESEAVGQVALILSRVLGPAMGRDPRFDAVFPRGVDFVDERGAYEALIAEGGRLRPPTRPTGRGLTPPSAPEESDVELAPDEDEDPPLPAPAPAPGAGPSILNP